MKNWRKLILIAVLVAVACIDLCMFWNSHLYHRAKGTNDRQERIALLERANNFFAWNDRVHYDLGKTYFASCIQGLSDGSNSRLAIQNASKSYSRSLRINPASPFSHFNYAQSLQFENLLTPVSDETFYDEYKNAAKLAGENRELMFEVGKKLLVCYKDLTDEDKAFVLDVCKRTLERKPADKFPALMNIWVMNVGDMDAITGIMPDDPQIFRMFGNFLGTKSFPLNDRQRMLSRADYLELKRAERLLASGEREFLSSRYGDAKQLFEFCLGSLYKIRFFHKISGQYAFDDSEYENLFKRVHDYLAKSILKSGGGLDESYKYIVDYLELETDTTSLDEFESFLTDCGIDDISLRLRLYHRQGRYREIADFGGRIHRGEMAAVETNILADGWALFIIGDAFRRMGDRETAVEFLERSLALEPSNIKALRQLRQIYEEELQGREKVQKIDAEIKKAMAPEAMIFEDWKVSIDQEFSRSLNLDGEKRIVELRVLPVRKEKPCLITIEWNGRVVWDDYFKGEMIRLELQPKVGKNMLRMISRNHPFILKEIMLHSIVR